MMFPAALGLFICALLLQTASGECPGEAPTKNLLCYVEVISSQFDPCLCTHLVLQTPLEKLTPQSELLLSARRLQERNPLLRIVLQVSESADVVLKKRSGYAQTVAQAVSKNSLDGVELALQWGKQVAGKVQLVDFVQGLSKDLDKLEPKDRSKRSYEIYENIPSDTVTPRWTLSANRKKSIRKIREVEDTDEEKETTTMKEDEEGKESTTTEEVKETSPKQEILEEPESEEKIIQIILHLTSEPQHLAKNFDLKRLSKYVSMYTLASDNLTDSSERGHTYHPSRLMGIEDILNADSLIDLVTGLGAPREKLVLSLPATALKFTLQDKGKNLPQSKTTGEPSKITRAELCALMAEGEWTVERDEDLTAPYAFHDTTWLAFDDPTSVSIKGKYVLLRDLSGAAVYNADAEDWVSKCNSSGPAVLKTLHDIFTHISRQSRAAQLVSLQEQLHEAGQFSYSGDVHLSPYRIVRVVDHEGSIHVVRKEAKTEFECSRQGYFRHPSGCNRFYRCVKFNQYTPDFTVFEYDCPAGLAFDETVEVCVWPGSLADGGACQGSSEIAPVPRSRYVCPQVAGYYADPENCRWFFACLDHSGDGSALTAYEFRCPFGLVFDEQALVCNWPWLVPGCGGAGVYRARFTVGDFYEGRHRPSYASLSDVHVSGGRIENVPGGVVLDSSVSGLGSGAYLGSFAAGSNVLGAGVYSGDASGAYNGLAGAGAGVYSGGASGAYNGLAGSGAAVYSGDASGAYNGLAGAGAAVYSGGASGAYNGLAGAGAGVGSGSESYIARGRGNGYSVGDQASGSYQTNSVSGSGAGYSSGSGAYSEELGKGYVSGSSDGSAYNAGLGAGTAYTSGSSAGFLAGGVGSSGLSLGSGGAGGPGGSGNAYTSGTGAHSGVSAGQISGIGEKYAAGGYGNSATVYSSGAQTQSGAGYIAGRVSGNGVYNAGEGISGTLHTFTGGAGDGTFSSGAKSVYSNKYAGASGIYGAGAYAGGDYSGAYIEDNSGAYIEDNSGAYIHDNSGDYKGDFSGLYSGKVVSDGQYAGGYSSGGAYVHGQYDNGAYKGSSVGGEQYKGNYVGGGAYSGSYDTGSYQGSGASDERYKEGYNTGGYSGKFDTGAYSGKYNTDGYSGKYDAGTYSGKYGVGGYSNKYDAGSYSEKNEGAYSGSSSGKYDSGFYSGKYEGGAYNGNSGAYQEGNYHSSSSSTQGGYKENHVPTTFVTDGGYASHEYNSVNVVEHKPAIGLVGLDAVKVSGGDFHSGGGYVSSYVTPTPLPAVSVTPVAPVVTSYSTVTPAPISVSKYTASTFQPTTPRPVTFYSIPSSPVTSVSSGPLASYSTVRPPLSVQTYQQPSYVKTATPTAPSYSYPTPTIGVVKTPVIPLNPVTYTYKQPIVNTEYVSSGANYNPSAHISGVTYEQQSYVKTVTPAPYYEEGSLAFAGPEYLPPLPSYRYDYKPVEGKYSYSKPAIYKSPVVPLNPVQYSTPASLPVAPLRPATHNVPVVKYTPTVLKTPVVPLNPVQYSTPVPVTYYSTPTPVKTVSFSTYSTPSPPPSYLPPLKPVTYSTPAPPVSYEYSAEPVRPISYTTPAPVTVFKTPIVPLNPVQYSTPSPVVSYEYLQPAPVQPASYAKPLRPATFSTYTTPAPVVNYEFSAPAVPVKPIVPLVSKAPLAPIQYTTPAPPRVDYSYLPPSTVDVKPVSPAITYKFASPAAVPVRPVVYSTPHKQYVAPVVIPTVLKTPVIPLNPVQYTTTPATVPVQPLRPITYSTSAPAVSYEYLPPAPVEQVRPLRPATYSTAAPPVNREYLPPRIEPIRPLKPAVYTTTAPPVVYKEYVAPVVTPTVLKTPVVPLNPVQYTTPTPNYIEYSTPASVPVKPLSSISYTAPAPAVNYEYLPPAPVEPVRPLRPIVYSKPAPPGNHQYLHPQPVKHVTYTSTVLPPVVNYEYPAPGVKPIVPTVLKTPLVPLNPVQYTTTAPLHIQYSTPAPLPVRPITLSSPAPFSYEYLPPKQVPTVLKTPVVPLNPVQYTTPAPAILQYSTPSPVPSVSYARPLRPVTYTTPAPAISYEYATAPAYVKPLPTVLKTPVIPLNPVQYSTPAPVVNQYQFGANLKTQTQYQSGVYYQKPAVVNTQYVQENYKYDQPKPIVDFIEPQKVVSTTPAPEVTYSYETPESVTPIYKQVYNYIKTPVVSAYDKVLGAVGYSTTPAPLPVQTVTQSPVAYTPSNVGYSYSKPALVKTPSIPVTPVNVVPEYNKVLNVVKATTTPAPVYVNHYTSSYEQEVLPVSTPQPVIYKQKPIVVPETYVKDYSYEENIEDAYDALKSDFGTRLTGGYEEGHAYNQQRVVVPEVNVYTSTTPSPVPVIKETYRVRKPVITYVQTYEQPAVAVNHEAGSYGEEAFYSSTANPAVVSSSEATYGEQYHKETSYSGFTGNGGVSTPCDHGVTHTSEGPAVRITTARVSLPVVTPRPQGGYYVRKQKVRVRPVVTTENYPDIYSSTYTPSTVSTTTYAPTYPTTAAPKLTTVHPDDVVDVEENEEEVKLLEGYNRQFGGIVGQGGYVASSTVANIEDGEAVVGVLKKGRITYDGRRTKSKVVVVSKLSDFNPLLVGKLGAECSCDGRSNTVTVRRNKQRGSSRLFTPSRDSTIPDQQLSDSYRTSTSTIAPIVVSAEESYESSSYDTPVVEIRPLRKRTRFQSTTTSAPAYEEEAEEPNYVPSGNERVKVDSGRVECKRAGLFRHPNKCNKFYSCNWDQWKKKFTLHEFKCPIHLAYDVNLGACNWPSKGPACAEDNLLV